MSATPVAGSTLECAAAVDAPEYIEAGVHGRPLGAASHRLAVSLRKRLLGRVAILGIGNPARGDDGVGCRVVDQLREALGPVLTAPSGQHDLPRVTLIDAEEIPESYLDVVEAAHPNVVLLIDAADMGAAPGSLVLVDAARLSDQAAFTHRTPLAPLARYLEERTCATVMLIGIQPASVEWDGGLTHDVEGTACQLVTILLHALYPEPVSERHPAAAAEAPVC